MNVFVLDNYDSFTFNLVQYLGELGATVQVARNDEADVDRIAADVVVVSPGPGGPKEAGASLDVVGWCVRSGKPLLGVCLGHQAIAEAFGGSVSKAPAIMHGKTSAVCHDGQGVFRGLPNPLKAMRYHSLAVDRRSLPDELPVTATTSDGMIMGIRHRDLPIEGVQFHPESILTTYGMQMLRNFLESLPD